MTSTTPVAYVVAFVAVAARNLCSSTPTALTPASRAGSFTSGVPYASTALHAVDQPTPNSAATAAVDRLPRPTCSHAHRRARSVSTARGAISGCVCDQLPIGHCCSAHRHSRLLHTSVTGRPRAGKSRTSTARRPFGLATTPHFGQPSTRARSWTSSSISPPTSPEANTSKSGRPTRTAPACAHSLP